MKKILGLAMATVMFLGAMTIIVPRADAFCTLRTANGRLLVWDCNNGIVLKIHQKPGYYFKSFVTPDGLFRDSDYPGATLWQYYADASCSTTPMTYSYTMSPNWNFFMESARFVDQNYFYVPSQTAIPTAANAILSTNSIHDPTCYSTAGWFDEDTPYVFTPILLKKISDFGNLPGPFKAVVPVL
jgi:hypothetical protein